jgi:hypothetical protein
MSDAVLSNRSPSSEMSNFLQPESMVTPGLAGGLTMTITNTLVGIFALPVALLPWIGLSISALFAFSVLLGMTPIWKRMIFWVLNTLVVFCIAMGTGNIAFQASQAKPSKQAWLPLVSTAHAQEPGAGLPDDFERMLQQIAADPSLTPQQKAEKLAELTAQAQANGWITPSQQQNSGFFKPWSFQN